MSFCGDDPIRTFLKYVGDAGVAPGYVCTRCMHIAVHSPNAYIFSHARHGAQLKWIIKFSWFHFSYNLFVAEYPTYNRSFLIRIWIVGSNQRSYYRKHIGTTLADSVRTLVGLVCKWNHHSWLLSGNIYRRGHHFCYFMESLTPMMRIFVSYVVSSLISDFSPCSTFVLFN